MSDTNGILSVLVRSRQGKVFSGAATSITSQNESGPFDVLPDHAHFISLIRKEVVISHESGKQDTFPVENGVIRVFDNTVDIYLGVSRPKQLE